MVNNPLITIYTPTYNRKKLLPRLYDSLCKQTCKDFIWLVIDDGSSDGTVNLINQWKQNAPFQIEYIYKENGGVHTARELAFSIVKSELVWGVDSDDWLYSDAVENLEKLWTQKGNDSFCGILSAVTYPNGKKTEYPKVDSASLQELNYKHKFHGDHNIIVRSSILKQMKKFPIYKNEKLVGEGYKWVQLPLTPFLILPTPSNYHTYNADGYSQNARKNYFRNLKGYRDNYLMHVNKILFLRPRLNAAIKYCVTCFFLKDFLFLLKKKNPLVVYVTYPISLCIFLILQIKWAKYKK